MILKQIKISEEQQSRTHGPGFLTKMPKLLPDKVPTPITINIPIDSFAS